MAAAYFLDQQGRHSLRVAHRWCDWQCPVDHGVKSSTVKGEQTEPTGQFGEVRPSSLVALRINGERAGIYVELLGEIDDQRRRRQLIRFQRARRIAQADQYQCEAKLVGFPTALRDKRQIFGSECRMAENLSLVRGKTKQPRPCRLASNLCLAITRPPCVGAWLV